MMVLNEISIALETWERRGTADVGAMRSEEEKLRNKLADNRGFLDPRTERKEE